MLKPVERQTSTITAAGIMYLGSFNQLIEGPPKKTMMRLSMP